MKLAFCLYKYFPYGGLQRDFMRIALDCQRRGHEIRVYTLSWAGEIPKGFDVIIVPVNALTNHTRYKNYSDWVEDSLQTDPVDCVVGINKMPGLDLYYAADSCYEEKAQSQRGWMYRQLPRYQHFAEYERAVFGEHEAVEVLMISETQKPFFKKYYGTPESHMHFLPPGISRDRIAPENAEHVRQKKRRELNVGDDEKLVLMVGSGFIKKGLRRALHAIKSLDRPLRQKTWFYIIGEDNQAPFKRLALLLGISDRVVFMSGRDDVPEFMLAGDLLLHPAMDENAGIVLLEAIVSGLPVLATDVCGYGHYIEEAGVGELVPSPFKQPDLNQRLQRLLMLDKRAEWWRKGKAFAETADIYSLPQEASRIIEQVGLSLQKKKTAKGELAFCLFKYFPYGGLQRDFIRVALQCRDRGFTIRVYTLSWQGEIPDGIEVVIVPVTAITNHKRYERYGLWVEDHIQHNPVNGVVGFNKMPGLDIYYAADSCYEDKAQTQRGHLYRAIPRYKHFSNFERAVFEPESNTRILMISEVQKPLFQKYYGTPLDRFHLLPPGISRDRIAPANSAAIRQAFREEFSIEDDQYLLLMVGSGFITKGLDRILLGMSNLPPEVLGKTRLMAVGQDNPNAFLRMANRLGMEGNVTILSGRDDIPRFLLGADLLVHPAYVENTGTVLLEAMVAGLPVLATDVCGYAHYVQDAVAGRLVPSPFDQTMFDKMLLEMLLSDERQLWRENGIKFGRFADVYSMPERAADEIVAALG
ncbi:MAG: UDP-glucose:(heptosyl)LPS alpha-1,3-glucosyltransferase [Candidatus Azotimanducaceae bacterium]|jgi:UDP-glucose:(heptosyl)LPS alpha-1,3-glucosyltransferase